MTDADVNIFQLRAGPDHKKILNQRLDDLEEIAVKNPLLTDNNQEQMLKLIRALSIAVYLFDHGHDRDYKRILRTLDGEL